MSIDIRKHDSIKKVEKPWGYEKWIADGAPDFKYALKEILFKSKFKSSIQFHEFKEETNYVQKGEGFLYYYPITVDFERYEEGGYSEEELDEILKNLKKEKLVPGMVFHVKPGIIHRVEAVTDLVLIESSTIELDDVKRINDEWGRNDGKVAKEHGTIHRPLNFHLGQTERIKFSREYTHGKVLLCSHGTNTQYYSSKLLLDNGVDEVWHFDSSLDKKITIRKLSKESKIEFYEGPDFSEIEKNTFECILTFEEIQFRDEPNKIIENYKKLLKENGILILSTRNKNTKREIRLLNQDETETRVLGFSKEEISDMIVPFFPNVMFFSQRDISELEQRYEEKSSKGFTAKLKKKLKKRTVDLYTKLDKNQNFYSLHVQKNIIEYRKKQFNKANEKFSIDYSPKPYTNDSNPQNFVVVCRN